MELSSKHSLAHNILERLAIVVVSLLVLLGAFAALDSAGAAASTNLACSPTGAGQLPLEGGGKLGVFDSLAQLLPSQPQTGALSASICQARNATESFQVEVTAGATPVTVSSVTASSLQGPGAATIPAADVSLFREDYTTLSTMSDGELEGVLPHPSGKCVATDCRFPDALIPDVDSLFHEKRDAFPFTVPAAQDRAVWVDAFVPAGQAPGLYTGHLNVTASTGGVTAVAVSLQVVNASVPSTSSVHSAFFMTLGGGRGLTGGSVTPAQYAEYAELGLDNRINIVPSSSIAEGSPTQQAEVLERYLQPLLTGTDPNTILKGAQLTDLPIGVAFGAGNLAAYKALLTKLGMAGRASIYCDEVSPEQCANSIGQSGFEALWPGLQVLATAVDWPDPDATAGATTESSEKLIDAKSATVKGLIQIAQYVDPIAGLNPFKTIGLGSRMPAYNAWRAKQAGRQVWDYTSCISGGCGEKYEGSSALSGWPSYGIDQVASEQRAMGWQMFAYGLDGEEYWTVNDNQSIWTSPYDENGMNGDGTLFYPWQAARVGGAKAIPIESIRLKRIRDGRQDYELLKLASQASGAQATAVASLVKAEFPSMDASGPTAASFDATRSQLMGLFGTGAAPAPAAPTAVLARTANAAATVRWQAPLANGSAPVSGYVVRAAPGGQSCSTTGTLSCVVKGLADNTSYSFSVTAQSASGPSPASTASNPVVPVVVDSIDDLNCDGTADFLAVQAESGHLLYYPRVKTGASTDWAPNVPLVIGSGFGGTEATLEYRSIFFAGDMNGDGAPDLIAVTSSGATMLLPGNCTGQVGAPISMGASTTSPIGVGDFNGDGFADVIDRHSDGTLWLLPGTGKGSFGAAQHIGSGWGGFDTVIAAGDVNGDGHPDLIARESNGTLLLYEGNGTGGWAAATENGGIVLAPKLPAAEYPVLVGDGDFDQNGTEDLSTIATGGSLLSFAGSAGNLASAGQVIGGGWQKGNMVEIVR